MSESKQETVVNDLAALIKKHNMDEDMSVDATILAGFMLSVLMAYKIMQARMDILSLYNNDAENDE